MGPAVMNIVYGLVHTLSPVHYFAFFISFFAWVFVLLITYALRGNKILLMLLSFFATFTFFSGPFMSYFFVESYVKRSQIVDRDTRQLAFVDKVVVKGNLANISGRTLHECRILSYALPKAGNIFTRIKTVRAEGYFASVSIDHDLHPGDRAPFYTTISGIDDYALFDLYHFTFCK